MRAGDDTIPVSARRFAPHSYALAGPQLPARPWARHEERGVPKGRARFCLVGFWGVPNFGDEWLFRAAQEFLRELSPDCGLSALVLSATVERQLGQHLPAVDLLEGFFPDPAFFARLPAIARAMRGADLTLIGGGGLINDTYTPLSIPRYVVPALLSMALGTPVVWWGLGVVPPRRRVLHYLAVWALRHAAAVLTRDPASRRFLQEQGVDAKLGEDLSILGASHPALPARHRDAGMLAVNFRDDVPALAPGRLAFLAAQAIRYQRVVLVAAEPCDEALYRRLLAELHLSAPAAVASIRVLAATEYAAIQRTLAAASLVVSERLHVSLFALAAQVPTIVLSYEPKIDEVVGRLFPTVAITSRSDFWARPIATLRPASTAMGPAEQALAKALLANKLRSAHRCRLSLITRIAASLWLALLLSFGACIAARKLATGWLSNGDRTPVERVAF